MSFLQLAAEERHHFWRAFLFIFDSSYFVKGLDGCILHLIRSKFGNRFIYFLCQIIFNMMHKSSQNQFGLIEKIKHQS